MWKGKELKRQSRAMLRANYLRTVAVCLLLAFFAGSYYHSFSSGWRNEQTMVALQNAPNSQIVNEFIRQIYQEINPDASAIQPVQLQNPARRATEGALATLFNNATEAGSFVFGLLNSLNQFIFSDRVAAGVVILIGAVITFLLWALVGNLLRVGECRFFLENRLYADTEVQRLLFIYQLRRVWPTAWAMLLRTIYVVLWCLTIVGGVIKSFSYRLVPYILAENPQIDARTALKLSERMMKGHKWRSFVLDLSFVGWELLSMMSLGFVGFLYGNPYRTGAEAELYRVLRQNAVAQGLPDAKLLNDTYLYQQPAELPSALLPLDHYPVQLFTMQEAENRRWLRTDYHRNYPLRHIILLFFTYCLIGWLWEVFYFLSIDGVFANRGVLHGPWLPIYGVGGTMILLFLRKLADRPALLFLAIIVLCGMVEYFAGWALEALAGVRWWDYSGFFLNLHGRVCLEALLAFGIFGSVSIYLLAPILDDLFAKIPPRIKTALCGILIAAFIIDLLFSFVSPNQGEGITSSIIKLLIHS